MIIFVVFIRFSSFGLLEANAFAQVQGRWPTGLNAVFNSTAHFLFILGCAMVFLPVFVGRLSLVRDIYAAEFLRPLARITYSAALMQGLGTFMLFFSQQQHVYLSHKNMIFIYFALLINLYLVAFFIALFVEYPFRTMAKIVFSPP